jgi:hypothetical protein
MPTPRRRGSSRPPTRSKSPRIPANRFSLLSEEKMEVSSLDSTVSGEAMETCMDAPIVLDPGDDLMASDNSANPSPTPMDQDDPDKASDKRELSTSPTSAKKKNRTDPPTSTAIVSPAVPPQKQPPSTCIDTTYIEPKGGKSLLNKLKQRVGEINYSNALKGFASVDGSDTTASSYSLLLAYTYMEDFQIYPSLTGFHLPTLIDLLNQLVNNNPSVDNIPIYRLDFLLCCGLQMASTPPVVAVSSKQN